MLDDDTINRMNLIVSTASQTRDLKTFSVLFNAIVVLIQALAIL